MSISSYIELDGEVAVFLPDVEQWIENSFKMDKPLILCIPDQVIFNIHILVRGALIGILKKIARRGPGIVIKDSSIVFGPANFIT